MTPLAPDAGDAIDTRLSRFESEGFARRLWARDDALWSADPAHRQVARTRLGWLESPERMRGETGALRTFASEVASEGFTKAVLLGMGGSSLAPEVFRVTFGVAPGALDLTVLDSTSPAAVRAVMRAHDPKTTLFLVSSKSGTTLEVSSFERHFFDWVRAGRGAGVGRAFVAITDPATPLEALARARGYRRVFTNPPDIGGRYSALSYFGLVPAALLGVDLEALLDRALDEARRSKGETPAHEIPGLLLGAALGELALAGHDKVTLVLGPEVGAFASWAEQLIAESTGKEGRGLVPIAGEDLGPPDAYGNDRLFVAYSIGPFASDTTKRLDALERAGHPTFRINDQDLACVGAEFLRWEIATVAASAVIGVDPFDEPNVTEAKQATHAVLERGAPAPRTKVAQAGPVFAEAPVALAATLAPRVDGKGDPAAWAAALMSLAQPGDYFALLAYFQATPARHERLQRIRHAARGATRLATTLGYGPRFLHSTGQLHKGGPNTGIFLQLTADEGEEIPIPGERFGFGALLAAQAEGDFEVLERRGRRVLRIHLGPEPERALESIAEAITTARV